MIQKNHCLFKSFTGLTVQEFDDIYDKEITKRYTNHEIQRLSSKRKDIRERKLELEDLSSYISKIDF